MQAIGFDLHCRGHAECIAIAANSSRLNRFSLSTASSVVDGFWSATNRVIISPPPSTTPATPTSPSTLSWRRSALASKASWPTTRTIKRPRHPPRRPRLQSLADRSLDDTDLASHRRKSRASCRSFHQNSGGVLWHWASLPRNRQGRPDLGPLRDWRISIRPERASGPSNRRLGTIAEDRFHRTRHLGSARDVMLACRSMRARNDLAYYDDSHTYSRGHSTGASCIVWF